METVHVYTFLSDMYINYAGACFQSLFENTKAHVVIHINCDDSLPLGEHNRNRLTDFVESRGHEIRFYEMKQGDPVIYEKFDEVMKKRSGRFAQVTGMTTFFLMKLLPPEVEKLICIGTDVIFNADILDLWHQPTGEAGIAATPEYTAVRGFMVPKAICAENGPVQRERYFCAGLMLIDIKKLNSHGINFLEDGMKLLAEHPEYDCVEQDVFNYYFSETYNALPLQYDAFVDGLRLAGEQEIRPYFYHYAGRAVNILRTNDVYDRLFVDYFRRSPFCTTDFLMNAFSLIGSVQLQHDIKTAAFKRAVAMSKRKRIVCSVAKMEQNCRNLFALREDEMFLVLPDDEHIPEKGLIAAMQSHSQYIFIFVMENYQKFRDFLSENGFKENDDFMDGSWFFVTTAESVNGQALLFDIKS